MTTPSIPRTERANPLTKDIDTWTAEKIVAAISAEDHRVAPAVAAELPAIARAAEMMAGSILKSGRVFYVGAGTSGRIGVLDASELEPTYGSIGARVTAIMAGGQKAVSMSSESSEDSFEDGRREMAEKDVGPYDLVIGVASSGRTPFVAGALSEARTRGARTIAVVGDNSGSVAQSGDLIISPDVGPEVVTGSTRMKNGTAQKLVLNMISTAAMIIAGRTYSNLMAGTAPRNTKLAGRALRILTEATGKSADDVDRAFNDAGGDIDTALVSLMSGATASEAAAVLSECGGAIRKAIMSAQERFKTKPDSDASPKEDISSAPAQIGQDHSRPGVPLLSVGQARDAGLDASQVDRAFQVVAEAVGDGQGRIPCAVASIVSNGVMLEPRAYGWAVRTPERIPATPDTIFDMASITKVTATLPSILRLLEKGLFRLDDPVARFMPEFGSGGKDAVTFRHLLSHTSALPAHIKFYEQGFQDREIIDSICGLQLAEDASPGVQAVYSDLGFIVLAELVKRLSGQEIDRFSRDEVFAPLGMKDTCYLPPPSERRRVAATEFRADLGRVMWGEVHDENAFNMGGIAGHAGLFSTVNDMARYALMWLGKGRFGGVRILSEASAEAAIAEETSAGDRRGLGWQLKSRRFSSGGDLLSCRSFGHTGFTGTSVWCDPETGTAAILLTNRVHAGREGDDHIRLRARFANAAAAAVR